MFSHDCDMPDDEIDKMFAECELYRAETEERAHDIANYTYDTWWDSGHPVEYGIDTWNRQDDIMSSWTDEQEDYFQNAKYRVDMPDGTVWEVPVKLIARHRASHYADEFGGKVMRSLPEDTLPLFMADPYEVHDWAANNMNWSDVEGYAKKIEAKSDTDYQKGWVNGDWNIYHEEK